MLGIFSSSLESLLRVEFFNFSVNNVTRMAQRPKSDIACVQQDKKIAWNRISACVQLGFIACFLVWNKTTQGEQMKSKTMIHKAFEYTC